MYVNVTVCFYDLLVIAGKFCKPNVTIYCASHTHRGRVSGFAADGLRHARTSVIILRFSWIKYNVVSFRNLCMFSNTFSELGLEAEPK